MFIDANGTKHYPDTELETAPIHTGKEKTYTSRTGLSFWFDVNAQTVWTNREDVYLFQYRSTDRENPGKAFFLHISGKSIAFSSELGRYMPSLPSEKENGTKYWKIGIIGGEYHAYEHTKGELRHKYYPLTNTNHFSSIEEQSFALALIEDILSNFEGSLLRNAHGKEQNAEVIFTTELQQRIAQGDFVKEAS